MNTKLTLNLDARTIKKAKKLAVTNRTSLSKMVEVYFHMLTKNKDRQNDISPAIKELSGIIKLPRGFDEKKEYRKYILKKYSAKKNG